MSALSNFLEDALIKHLFKNTPFTSPGDQIWIALSTADPLETGAGLAEPADTYARQQVTAANWTDNADGSVQNAAQIQWAVATASWGTLTHVAIMSAVTAGNMYYHGPLAASKAIATDDQAVINAGQLVAALT